MKAHLLYVEDDESLSFVTRDNLELQGYQITYCSDGQQALDVIKEQTFDLCILDVMLPEVDGFTIAETIRKTDSQVPIIFLTARSLKEDRIHGLKLGGDDYLTKPFSIEELILKIEIFLRRSKISGPSTQSVFQVGNYSFDYKN
ncbi:MAG: response regulator transcription factor, partial [Saprospiraceae bacterium]